MLFTFPEVYSMIDLWSAVSTICHSAVVHYCFMQYFLSLKHFSGVMLVILEARRTYASQALEVCRRILAATVPVQHRMSPEEGYGAHSYVTRGGVRVRRASPYVTRGGVRCTLLRYPRRGKSEESMSCAWLCLLMKFNELFASKSYFL